MTSASLAISAPPAIRRPEVVIPAAFEWLTDGAVSPPHRWLRNANLNADDAHEGIHLLRRLGFVYTSGRPSAAGRAFAEIPSMRALFLGASVSTRFAALRDLAPSPDDPIAALAWLTRYHHELQTLRALNQLIQQYDDATIADGGPSLKDLPAARDHDRT